MLKASGIVRTSFAPKAGPQVDGFYVESEAAAADFGVVKRTIQGDSAAYFLPFVSVITQSATGTVTLTAEQNGATVLLDSTDPITVELPAATPGLEFTVIVLQADNAHEIGPASGDAIGANGLTATANEDLVNSTSTAYASAVLRCVTTGLWHAVVTGTWTKAA